MQVIGILGAGGFAREVMPIVRMMITTRRSADEYKLVFVTDGQSTERSLNGYDVVSYAEFIAMEADQKCFNVAIADSKKRAAIAQSAVNDGLAPIDVIANNALILDANTIAEGAIICPFVSITSNARIGKYFHANIYSYVAHDCVVGDFVTFAPNVHCNGNVVIKDHAYIGAGAIIKQGAPSCPIVIGEGAVVGMGAVVTKSVPDFTTVVGNPARQKMEQQQ